jgi:hypothetical protein
MFRLFILKKLSIGLAKNLSSIDEYSLQNLSRQKVTQANIFKSAFGRVDGGVCWRGEKEFSTPRSLFFELPLLGLLIFFFKLS